MRLIIIAAAVLAAVMPAAAQELEVSAFGYASRSDPGSFEVEAVGEPIEIAGASIEGLVEHAPEWARIRLFCTGSPGARFMEAGGHFYTLNGKSRRPGAFVETDKGRRNVDDSSESPSPLADHPSVVISLVQAAEAAC